MRAALPILLLLAGCASLPEPEQAEPVQQPAPPPPDTRRGAYYKDDGPGERSAAELAAVPDAEPKAEPLHRFANRPYQVFGREYVPLASLQPYRQRGTASWYGRRFHGNRTSTGERYDMYAMSAAHPTLPIPSYARVTNLGNGRSIVVRVNDRGPYVGDRIIDLSVQSAKLLGFHGRGLAKVKVDYVGRAPLEGSDDRKLMATLRDGAPATVAPVQVASNRPFAPAFFDNRPMTQYSSVQDSSMQVPAPPACQ